MKVTAYLGLGSNLDNPLSHVAQACADIAAIPGVEFLKVSSLYQSPPLGPVGQPDYVNAVAEIATTLVPEALLDALQAIENAHGRIRGDIRWSARTLDIDILLFGEEVISADRLTVPHPGLYERAFVLYPLQEIAPDLQIPGNGSLAALVRSCEADGLKVIGRLATSHNNDK